MFQKVCSITIITIIVIVTGMILNNTVYKRILPYYWGSSDIGYKRKYLIQNKERYNTIFLGSSKTHNQIIPKFFDQKCHDNNLNITSYNFGVSGLLPLESLNIYENLITKDSINIKNAFIELDWIETINYENLNQVRSFYWLHNKNYLVSINSIKNSAVPINRKIWGYFHYSLNFLENTLNVGKAQEFIKFQELQTNQIYSASDSNNIFRGYIPLFDTLKNFPVKQYNEVISDAKTSIEYFTTLSNNKPSKPYVNKLQEIVDISKKKGIKVYFIIPLQWKYYQYKEILPAAKNITGADIIYLFDPIKFKEMYTQSNFADPNHLNYKGAQLYTEEIFNSFFNKK